MRKPLYYASALLASVLIIAACGSNDTPPLDRSAFRTARALASHDGARLSPVVNASRAARSPARQPTAEELLNWAEVTFPALFPAPRPSTWTVENIVYRYYSATDLALGVMDGTTVLGLIDATKPTATLVQLGQISDYTCSVLPSSCAGQPASFDASSVSSGANEVAAFIAVCAPAGSTRSEPTTPTATQPSLLSRSVQAGLTMRASAGIRPKAYTSTRPADKLGSCGGRISYPEYSHSSGITTATRVFDNYCTQDSDTGERTYYNGTMAFVNTATPTASGPITTQLVANSPTGITTTTTNAAGTATKSQTASFTNYVFRPGVPGGDPTPTSPDEIRADEISVKNELTGKTYRQTGYVVSMFDTPDGGEQATISGRGYRSNGQYFDISTTSPIKTNSSGDYQSGVLSFLGANGSTAVATVVPGENLQTTMTIDGQPVTSVPACSP